VSYTLDRDGGMPGLVSASPDAVVLEVDGVRRRYRIHRVGDRAYVDSPLGSVTLTEVPRFTLPKPARTAGSLLAPMPATVGRVTVTVGQRVAAGDLLLTLEAMKMEHAVYAPDAGVVAELDVQPGSQVDTGTLLAVVTPDSPEESA
jgi:propionyl-CoA carboxylase alpha chain